MFSAVGWICIEEDEYVDDVGDTSSDPREPTVAAVRRAVGELAPAPEAVLGVANATWTLLLNTHHNHRQEWPERLFRRVAEIAPGSFGFMHVWDDEHPTQAEMFMRWTMVLGRIDVDEETALRPVIERWLESGSSER